MALAGIPGGEGISSLVKLAQQIPDDLSQYNKLPLQMLAQLSAQYPDASSALLDMARQNQMPENAWPAIVAGLADTQFQFTRQLPQNTPPPGTSIQSGTSTPGGNPETFYGVPLRLSSPDANISQRLAVIDQLLAATSKPTAVAALQQARARLTGAAK